MKLVRIAPPPLRGRVGRGVGQELILNNQNPITRRYSR